MTSACSYLHVHFNCGADDDHRLIPTSRVDDGELYSSAAQQCLLGSGYLCSAHVIELSIWITSGTTILNRANSYVNLEQVSVIAAMAVMKVHHHYHTDHQFYAGTPVCR